MEIWNANLGGLGMFSECLTHERPNGTWKLDQKGNMQKVLGIGKAWSQMTEDRSVWRKRIEACVLR